MKRIRKVALAGAVIATLGLALLAVDAAARSSSFRAPRAAGAAAIQPPLPIARAPKLDSDGDRLFEDLEQRLRATAPSERLDVIVRLRDQATPERVADLERLGGGFDAGRRFTLVRGFEARVTPAQAEALARSSRVVAVELDSTVRAANDTAQASFGVTDARLQAPTLDGSADGNVDVYTPSDLVAAVIDTGVDAAHADLDEGKVLAFRDFVNGAIAPYDDDGHGTHVAGTLAGEGDARADRRYRGVAPGAGLVSAKVLDQNGDGTESDVLAGIQWVVDNKALHGTEAMNLSLGAAGCSAGTDALSAAVNAAHDAGISVSVAAGNEGPGTCTIGSPSAAAKPLTVGSMADFGVNGFYQAFDSSRGKTADGRIKPDVSAPGVGITSVAAGTATGYVDFSGTSMATPFIAGVALLMLDANPALGPQGVKDRITGTAIDWARGGDNRTAGTSGPDIDYGTGRLDAHEALRSAGAAVERSPSMPVHQLREGTLSGTGTQIEYDVQVNDTQFPIGATLIMSSVTAGTSTNPDFDLYLLNPSGQQVASSEFTTRQEEVGYRPTVLGTYKLRVRSFRGSGPFFVDVSSGSGFPGYARPQGAVNARVPLVIAYEPCAAPGNRTHGPSLSFPSCSPPQQQSDHLTVGTLDANGQDTRSVASVRVTVLPGDSSTPAEDADVRLSLGATDIRRSGTLADYAGELQARFSIRITDRSSGPSFTDPATVIDVPFSFTAACAPNSDPSVGSSCAVTTTADATVPGAVVEGKRAIWELGQIEVLDGGADGIASTGPNTVFARQGVFTP